MPYPDSKVPGANMGPIWGQQDPGGPHVGPVNIAIWVYWQALKYFTLEFHTQYPSNIQWREIICQIMETNCDLWCHSRTWTQSHILTQISSKLHPGPWFNIKMTSYRYRNSHCGDKTVVRSSYVLNGISYTGKMTSLYWVRAQGPSQYRGCLSWYRDLHYKYNGS